MSCENLLIPKPITSACVTNLFGIPYGVSGRTVGGVTYPIAGVVLHCYSGTSGELCNEMKCRTKQSVISGSAENSYHYGIGASTPGLSQYVTDNDISWSFGAYKANSYVTAPPPNVAINWPTLQGLYGVNVTPDVYTIDIALAIGHIVDATQSGCFTCPTSSGLQQNQHDVLVQLLAYLAQEYSLPIDSEHITFHDLIRCDEGQECACIDIETLLAEVAAFCPPCAGDEAPIAPEALPDDEIQHIMGITEACCPGSAGCYVKIPWNECFMGDLATDGDLEDYILGLSQDPITLQWCLTRGCLGVTTPLQGCGTVNDPLNLDLCAFGAWIPDEPATNVVTLVGIDSSGCLIESPAADVVTLFETPITPVDTLSIDLTVSGISDHTLQADLIVSPQAGNQVEVLADGVYVDFDCDDITAIFDTPGTITTLYGFDSIGDCVTQVVGEVISDAICLIPEDDTIDPTWVLTKDDVTCPVFTTPQRVVAAGFSTMDSDCISITWNPPTNMLSIDPIIDPAADNILTCGATGMYVPDLVPVATDCIAVSYVGRNLTISPIISPAIGGVQNQITCEVTGLFVPRGADTLVNGPLIGSGSDLDPLDIDFTLLDANDLCDFGSVIPAGTLIDVLGRDGAECLRRMTLVDLIAAGLAVNDTNCLDLTLIGNTLSGDIVISGTAGNVLTCTGSGLYVPEGAGLGVTDTNCIDLDLTANILTATIILDPAGDNQVSCGVSGLYVPPVGGLVANDTDCVNLDLAGGILTGTITLAGTQAGVPNVLNCITGQGLYVPEGAGLAVIDTNCIDLTLVGGVLTADIILDPTGDNQVTCVPAGLYVPPTAGLLVLDTDCINLTLTGDTLSATPILAGAQGGIANGLSCIAGQGLYVPNCPPLTITNVQNLVSYPRIVYDATTCTLNMPPIIAARISNNILDGINTVIPLGVFTALTMDFGTTNNDTTGGVATANSVVGQLIIPVTGVYDLSASSTYVHAVGAAGIMITTSLDILINGTSGRSVTGSFDRALPHNQILNAAINQGVRTVGDVITLRFFSDTTGGSVDGATISIKMLEE